MSSTDFAPLVAILLTLAQSDWAAMRVKYRYDEPQGGISETSLYAITAKSNQQWVEVGSTTFDMLDFFDTYRKRTRPALAKGWSSVTVTIRKGENEPAVEFGYEAVDLLDRRR